MTDPTVVTTGLGVPKTRSLRVQCEFIKRNGMQCQRYALRGATRCYSHTPRNDAKKKQENRQNRLDGAVTLHSEAEIRAHLQQLVAPAVRTLQEIIDDDHVKPEIRLRAAEAILSRFVASKVETRPEADRDERDLDEELDQLVAAQAAPDPLPEGDTPAAELDPATMDSEA